MKSILEIPMIESEFDSACMRRALVLAQKGRGHVAPNPMVGAVIVNGQGAVLGEGYHQLFGGAHAEINAINHAKSWDHCLKGATLYVTLEPCSHHGKTPPCVDAILHEGIARVVVATKDPNPLVSGRGIKKLMDHGVQVDVGLLENEAKQLNATFIKYITEKLPYITLKTAMTLDGKIATVTGQSQWISSLESRAYTHQLRHESAAIMVGIGTVLKDDPRLTTRMAGVQTRDPMDQIQLDVRGIQVDMEKNRHENQEEVHKTRETQETQERVRPKPKDPHRIIVDTHLRIPLEAKVLHLESTSVTFIACAKGADPQKVSALEARGARVLQLGTHQGRVDLNALMLALGEAGIDSILLEGGAELNFSALQAGIVDKVLAFVAPKVVGGSGAKGPVGGQGIRELSQAIAFEGLKARSIGEDVLLEAVVKSCLQV